MKASAFALGLCAALLLGAAGCDDVAPRVLLDLEGPRGEAEAPGPWTIAILTDGTVPRLFIAVDEDGFSTRPVTAAGAGQFVGVVPPLPVGTSIRYYAEAGGETAPAAGPRVVEIVAPRGPEPDASVGRCGLSFRAPLDGQQLREGVDDTAPQSGLQFTVIVDTDLLRRPRRQSRARTGTATASQMCSRVLHSSAERLLPRLFHSRQCIHRRRPL